MRDFEISVWDSITDTRFKENRRIITIAEFFNIIKGAEYQFVISKIRAERDDDKRKVLKEMLPAVTVSGVFNERKNASLLRHSHFLCLDFDKLGNQKQNYKDKLKEDKFVYGFFTSASGNGLAVIVKIDPLRHQETFDALAKYFYNQYGLVADIGCKDVSRLRFFSHDPDAHTYYQALVFDKFPKADKQPKKHYVSVPATNSDIGKIVNQAMQRGCDITDGSYAEWMRLAASLVTLGEQGRPYFHILSQYNPKYNHSQCDRMFNNIQKGGNGSITIGTFFYFARRAGLNCNTEKNVNISKICKEVKARKDGTAENAVKKLQEKNIICTDEDEVSKNEDIELVKKVYETIESDTGNDFGEVKNYVIDNYSILFNEITDENEYEDGKVFAGDDYSRIYLEVKEQYDKVKKSDVIDIIRTNTPRYNPLRKFIEENRNLISEGKTQGLIKELALTITSDTAMREDCFDGDYEEYFITKWYVGMIASIHGNVSPLLLALTGKQATGKTHWFRHLLPEGIKKYYAEIKLSTDKDAYAAMTKNLLIMDDELTGKTKMEEQHLKEITSKAVFTYRPPYGITHIHRNRLAVLAGTTNDEKVLSDPTGNRRIIPINVLEINHKNYNSINKTALFMEAVKLYESGFAWELSLDDIKRLNENTVQHLSENFERELISIFFDRPESETEKSFAKFMTTTDIILLLEKETTQKLNVRKIGMELRMLNYERIGKKINGSTKYGYLVRPKNLSTF